MSVDLAIVKSIYRQAIDSGAHDAEGEAWWAEVAAEMQAVIDAPSIAAAAQVIAWWHHDWASVGDTAACAARRMRSAASRLVIIN